MNMMHASRMPAHGMGTVGVIASALHHWSDAGLSGTLDNLVLHHQFFRNPVPAGFVLKIWPSTGSLEFCLKL